MQVKFYDMAQPYFPSEEIQAILAQFEKILQGTETLSQGKQVHAFEKAFAKYAHCEFAVATNACSAALEIALRTLALSKEDEVIVPVETFIATGSAIVREGGKPVFANVDPNTFCISLEEIKRLHTKKTKAVIVVHMAGLVTPEIEAIADYCKRKNIFLIEDAAHAPGAEYNGRRAGSFGDCGCFSFYPTKVMTTGEGGMLTTNNSVLFKKCNAMRHRGRDLDKATEQYTLLGTNNRMTEIAAILGLSQLRCIDDFIEKRNKIAQLYQHYFSDSQKKGWVSVLPKSEKNRHTYWRFIIKIHEKFDRTLLQKKLKSVGIPIDWAYTPLLHLQPVFEDIYPADIELVKTEKLMQHFFCLPIHPLLSNDDVYKIAEEVNRALIEMANLCITV